MPQIGKKLNNGEKIMFGFKNIITMLLTIMETPIFGIIN